MRTAVDTNVISALWSREPLADTMAELLDRCLAEGGIVVSAPVYAELLAHPRASAEFVDGFLASTGIMIDFDLGAEVWHSAGTAFAEYAHRRRQARVLSPKRLLADFLVGAHALLRADRLLTLDPARYRQAFPRLRLLADREH